MYEDDILREVYQPYMSLVSVWCVYEVHVLAYQEVASKHIIGGQFIEKSSISHLFTTHSFSFSQNFGGGGAVALPPNDGPVSILRYSTGAYIIIIIIVIFFLQSGLSFGLIKSRRYRWMIFNQQ